MRLHGCVGKPCQNPSTACQTLSTKQQPPSKVKQLHTCAPLLAPSQPKACQKGVRVGRSLPVPAKGHRASGGRNPWPGTVARTVWGVGRWAGQRCKWQVQTSRLIHPNVQSFDRLFSTAALSRCSDVSRRMKFCRLQTLNLGSVTLE